MTHLEVLQAYGEAVGSSVERKLNRPCCSAPWPCHTKVDQPGTLCYRCERETDNRAREAKLQWYESQWERDEELRLYHVEQGNEPYTWNESEEGPFYDPARDES